MRSHLKELLDKIYELEGLVHLALKREEDTKDFIRLISKKGIEVGEICRAFSSSDNLDSESYISDPSNYELEEYALDDDCQSEESYPVLSEIIEDINEENKNEKPVESLMEPQRGKLVFSINERFRFRKELFENSDADFNTTLALVASMESFDEAEDYFINEEGFDASNPIVKEFLEVIKKYFK